jgi:hypothetical protein
MGSAIGAEVIVSSGREQEVQARPVLGEVDDSASQYA